METGASRVRLRKGGNKVEEMRQIQLPLRICGVAPHDGYLECQEVFKYDDVVRVKNYRS